MLVENLVKKAFQLKGRLYTLTVLQMIDPDLDAFSEQLEQMIKLAPKMFDTTPMVLDFSKCQSLSIDLDKVITCLQAKNLIPIGVQGVEGEFAQSVKSRGLVIMSASTGSDREIQGSSVGQESEQDSNQCPPQAPETKLITTPVRSGQQIYAKNGDLIVASSVSRGAEVLADGNIHVYGCLRGRALAGIQGNQQSRIFCLDLDAELVSIAGIYALNDKIKRHSAGPKQVSIREERIVIDELG